jgi:hypothetical protein
MTIPTQMQDLTVTTSPSQADAQLVVSLSQLGQAMNVDRGQAVLWKHRKDGGLTFEQFEATYPIGSEGSMDIINVMKWYETIGTLVKQGLLDRGLVLDWLWVAGSWEMCQAIALGHRAETGPEMWENFEALAVSQT